MAKTIIEQPEVREFFAGGVERPRNPEAERYFLLISEKHRGRWGAGEVNPVREEMAGPSLAAQEVKAKAFSLGANLVGITTVTQDHVYQGKEVPERYLISLAMEMDFGRMATAPSLGSGAEAARVYYELGEVTIRLAEYIRSIGYHAYAHHPLGAGRMVQVPYAIAVGLGEQGRNGILVTPQYGCRVRLAAVTTDLPLATDRPQQWGIGAFCEKCQRCFRACPAGAIPAQRSLDRGISHYVIHWEKCRPYFDAQYSCAICIKVCPFSRRPDARFLDKVAALKG
ncbi:MAG: reductive dehalogenase domain-containing protein [Dehalococcoidia bacterium]